MYSLYLFTYRKLQGKKSEPEGIVNGIAYKHLGTKHYSKHKILRVLGRYYYFVNTIFKIINDHKNERISHLIISNDYLLILFIYSQICKIYKIKSVFITDEYPISIRKYLKPDIPQIKKFLYNKVLKSINMMVFMTNFLQDFYYKKLNKPYFILPTIIDEERFENIEANIEYRYMCYMGNMELSKDNVDNIIKAFLLLGKNTKIFSCIFMVYQMKLILQ